MNEPAEAPALSLSAEASHDVRIVFEKYGLALILVLIVVMVLIGLAGALVKPPAPCGGAGCIPPVDWGAAVVDRVVKLKDTVLDLLMTLGSTVGLSMTRGHMDERLKQ